MEEKKVRKVQTGLDHTDKNHCILSSVIGQMSDGIWENSPRMVGYWACIDTEADSADLFVSTEYADTYYDVLNPYRKMTDKQIKKYFANKIKQIVKINMEDNYIYQVRKDIYDKYALNMYFVRVTDADELQRREKAEKEYEDYITAHPFTFRGVFNPKNDTEVEYLSVPRAKVTVKDAYEAYQCLIK